MKRELLAAGLVAAGAAAASQNNEVQQAGHKVTGAVSYAAEDAKRWASEEPSQGEEKRRAQNEAARIDKLQTGAEDVTRVLIKLPKGLTDPRTGADQTSIQATLPHKKGEPIYFVSTHNAQDGNVSPENVDSISLTKTMPNGEKTVVEIEDARPHDPEQAWQGREYVVDGNGNTVSESRSIETDFSDANNNSAARGTIAARAEEVRNFNNAGDLQHDAVGLAHEAVASIPKTPQK